jgi:cellulose synthase/poly-beta-1,6-N-acetylglucosamine synthase-like glycosyltransferase
MTSTEYVFWGCLLVVVYTYLLYPLYLFVAYALAQVRRDLSYLATRRDRRACSVASEDLLPVSLIIPAYNEQDCLLDKIANIRQIDYPRERLEVIFVSDGSTDRTNEILRASDDYKYKTVFLPRRKGKSNALNVAVERAGHEILILSDASTLFAPDAVRNLVRHFSDPKVGVVCGSLCFQGTLESRQTEGVYWKYESMLRLMEARLGATLTASGAIYALRRESFRPVPPDTVIEDFVIPMNARKLGYRVLYDPEAVATEFPPSSVRGEFARRARLAVGSFQALGKLARVPLRGFSALAFFSHKVLRWVVPFMLIGLLASNCLLLSHPLYRIALGGQMLFYFWAGVGFTFPRLLQRVRFGLVGYFLLAMNLAFLVGFVRFLLGREEAAWQQVN